jgi:hypothetical protein
MCSSVSRTWARARLGGDERAEDQHQHEAADRARGVAEQLRELAERADELRRDAGEGAAALVARDARDAELLEEARELLDLRVERGAQVAGLLDDLDAGDREEAEDQRDDEQDDDRQADGAAPGEDAPEEPGAGVEKGGEDDGADDEEERLAELPGEEERRAETEPDGRLLERVADDRVVDLGRSGRRRRAAVHG